MIKSNFAQFKKELDKEIEEKQVKLSDSANEIILTAYSQIQRLSPVDTGQFRASHFMTKNQLTQATGQPNEESQRDAEARAVTSKDIKNGDKIYIQNNLPYAQALENGSSQQSPSGIYGVVEERTRRRIQLEKRQSV